MIICTKCGQNNEGGATFCARCSAFLEWTGERVEERPTPGPVTPQAVPATRSTHPSTVPVPPDRLVLTTLSNSVQTVDPGNQAVFTLEVRNLGPTVDRLAIEVLGDVAAWAEVEPPALNLMPGTSGTATVRFRPPRSSAMRAGDVSFGVGIRSAEHPGASVVERGVISITPFTELEVELAPRVTHGRRGGSVTVRAANAGNVPVSLALAGGDPENALGFRFTPSTLRIEPGATALASIAVSADGPFLFGSRRSRPFQIVATAADQPRRTLEGTFQQTAFLPLWIPAGLVLGAAALGVFVVANPFGGKSPATATPTQVPVTAAPPTPEEPTPTPTPTPEPEYTSSTVHVSGNVHLLDTETWPFDDETRDVPVDSRFDVPAAGGHMYSWWACVGDEVTGYLDLNFTLDKTDGAVIAVGNAQYYESDDCGKEDLEKQTPISFRLAPDGTSRTYNLSKDLKDGAGGVMFGLTFENASQKVGG